MLGKASPTVAREALLARRRRQRLESHQSLKSTTTSSKEDEDSYGTNGLMTGPSRSIESNDDSFSHPSDTSSFKNLRSTVVVDPDAATPQTKSGTSTRFSQLHSSSIRGDDTAAETTTTTTTPKTTVRKAHTVSDGTSLCPNNKNESHTRDAFLSEDEEEEDDTTFSHQDPDMSYEDSSQEDHSLDPPHPRRYSKNHQQAFRMKQQQDEEEDDLQLYSSRPPHYHLTPDSSCIPYHSMIMIAHSSTTTAAASLNQQNKASLRYLAAVDPSLSTTFMDPMTSTTSSSSSTSLLTAQMTGRGLSQPYECFIIQPISLQEYVHPNVVTKGKGGGGGLVIDTHNHNASSSDEEPRKSSRHVQCGDIVSIHSPTNHNRALGVRRKKNIPGDAMVEEEEFDVGFFHRLFGPVSDAEQWMVLSGVLPGRVISVRQNVLQNSSSTRNPLDKTLVRVGQPLILQNVLTGGILSCTTTTTTTSSSWVEETTKLSILTTMYQRKKQEHESTSLLEMDKSHNTTRGSTIGKDLLHFLTEHIRIPITSQETFTMIPVNIPPIPSWASSASFLDERVYLNGFFLRYPQRLDIHVEMEEDLFRSHNSVTTSHFKGHRGNHTIGASTVHYQNLESLARQSVDIQEKVLVDDILGAMMGLEGNLIRAYTLDPERVELKSFCHVSFRIISESATGGRLDVSLMNLVSRLLPACDAFVNVHAFVSSSSTKYEMGKIAHALCSAVDVFLQEYLESIVLMEDRFRHASTSSPIKMSELYADNRRLIETITILDQVVSRIKESKGGSLLNSLYDMMMEYSGNELAKTIFSQLLESASNPYFDMLTQWLQSGYLQDPYGEFMIQQSHLGSLEQQNFILYDDDWSKWYSLRPDHVFQTLTSSVGISLDTDSTIQKILLTGKYWNAVSLCKDKSVADVRYVTRKLRAGLDVSKSSALSYQTFHVDVCTIINNCFDEAAQTLYNVMIRDYQLIEVLRFTKSYFLLDQGDFFIHFMDMAEDELLQEMPAVSKGRVGAWTKYSLQLGRNFPDISSQDNGSHCKALRNIAASLQCDFALDSLVEALDHLHAASGGIQSNEPKTPSRHLYGGAEKGLTGIEAFMLTYGKRYFPLSLFLSTRTISNYQLLFRHIFFAKHVERRLVGIWLDHQMIKEYHQSLRQEMGPTFCLRHRMLHFVQNFVYYMMFEVIEPNWNRMVSQIRPSKEEETETNSRPIRTVDDILKIHNDFVKTSLKECLLTNRNLVRTFTKLLTTCLLFSDQMKLFMETTDICEERNKTALEERHKRDHKQLLQPLKSDVSKKKKKKEADLLESQTKRKQRNQDQIDRLRRELTTESYKKMIKRFEQVFNSNLTEFMSLLAKNSDGHYNSHLFNLCIQLDYNGHLSHVVQK